MVTNRVTIHMYIITVLPHYILCKMYAVGATTQKLLIIFIFIFFILF